VRGTQQDEIFSLVSFGVKEMCASLYLCALALIITANVESFLDTGIPYPLHLGQQ
jgi:hypothetical protein